MYDRFGLRREPVPWLAFSVFALGVLVGLRLLFGGSVSAQQVGFPTPPPGPEFPLPPPEEIQATVIRSVDRPESDVRLIRAGWPGPIPLIPPVPQTVVTYRDFTGSGLPVTLHVDTGTFTQAVQLRMTSVDPSSLPEVDGIALWAFSIEAFSKEGQAITTPLQRPIGLSIPTGPLSALGIDQRSLLIGISGPSHVTPLATTFSPLDETSSARLLRLGTVVLIDDEGPP